MPATLIITRTFEASPQQVWEAWTTPEQFAEWFGTKEILVPVDSVSMDVRVGGLWKATMKLPDRSISWVGEFTEIEPHSRLALTISDDPDRQAGLPVTVDIEETAGGTRMTLTQDTPYFSDEQFEMTVAGYNGFFDDMAALFAPA